VFKVDIPVQIFVLYVDGFGNILDDFKFNCLKPKAEPAYKFRLRLQQNKAAPPAPAPQPCCKLHEKWVDVN
jgi:hypothetical protein